MPSFAHFRWLELTLNLLIIAAMKSLLFRCAVLLCALLISACSAKTGKQVVVNLWSKWESFDLLLQSDYPDAVPVILIHGWNGGEFSWPDPERLMAMEKRLKRDIYLFNYRTSIIANRLPPIELLEEQLANYLKNYSQVDIVSHSMGGLLLRYYLLEHPDSPVRRVLFLSTPHFGTSVANVLVELGDIAYSGNIQANELVPGSDFLWQLNGAKGDEMAHLSVLNVYAREQKNLLRGDIVVPAAHAWLPWVANSEVDGDHHLGRRIDEPWAMNFLAGGALPEPAPKPADRELWLRIQPAGADAPLSFNETSVHRYQSKMMRHEKQFSLCCEKRSGLHELGGTTLVLKDVREGEIVRLFLRNSLGERTLNPATLARTDVPVAMMTIDPDDGLDGEDVTTDRQGDNDSEAIQEPSAQSESGTP